MNINENEFFRQATVRICSSLNVETALSRAMEYLKTFLPLSGMCLGLYDDDFKSMRTIASAGEDEHRPPDTVWFSDDVWGKIRAKEGTYGPVFVVNDVVHRIADRTQESMSGLTAGMGLPPGMKLPF